MRDNVTEVVSDTTLPRVGPMGEGRGVRGSYVEFGHRSRTRASKYERARLRGYSCIRLARWNHLDRRGRMIQDDGPCCHHARWRLAISFRRGDAICHFRATARLERAGYGRQPRPRATTSPRSTPGFAGHFRASIAGPPCRAWARRTARYQVPWDRQAWPVRLAALPSLLRNRLY
jgi:hypothetical protein